MSATRFPRLRVLLVPITALTWFSVPVHPASALPATFDRGIEVAVAEGIHTLALPITTNLLAASTEVQGSVPKIAIRTVGGSWTPLRFESDHGPDGLEAAAADPRQYSDPIWLGTASTIQVRAAAPAALRLHLVNSKGDIDRGPLGAVAAFWRALTVPRHAEAAVPDQPIITRERWGADESWVDGPPGPAEELDAFFVHHTASGNGYSRADVPAIIRGIYRYHTKTRGWSDIGYNFLIDRFGRMYEGRAGSILEPMIGAHARGANDGSAGVSLIGDFGSARVPDATRTSLVRLIAWKADLHHVPLTGTVRLPDGGTFKRINGHRDANSTACPGASAYELLPWVRKAASTYGGPKLFKPRPTGSVLRPDGDGIADTWRLLAWGNQALTWTLEFSDTDGTIVRSLQMTGTRLESGGSSGLAWDGRDALGALVPSGRYTWMLRAQDANGEQARPAAGELLVITDHVSGTVLADDAGAYLVDAGSARTVPPLTLRTLYARRGGAIVTGSSERSRYTAAPLNPVPPRQGALLRTPTGEMLIVASATEVRAFSPTTIAATLGYRAKNAVAVTDEDLLGTSRGTPITISDRHPVGAFVREGTTIYRIRAADRILATPFVVSAIGATFEVVDATPADLSLPIAAGSLTAPDGAIAWRDFAPPTTDAFWLLAGGQRRLISDQELFTAYGPWFQGAVTATYADIRGYTVGDPIR